MELHAALLETIPQTKYLSADNYSQYRAIMRIFYMEYQSMHYQLDKEYVLERLRRESVFAGYVEEQLRLDLDQLVNWKNLTPIQDPHKVYSVADYKNKQFLYTMSEAAVEVERMTITLENLFYRTSSLSSSLFRRIYDALTQAEAVMDQPPKEIGEWWENLQEDFKRLNQNYQDYLRDFYTPSIDKTMKSAAFVLHKQQLVRYLQDFIQDMQASSAQMETLLVRFSPERVGKILDGVYRSELEVPRPPSEKGPHWKEGLREQLDGKWRALTHWFVGEDCVAGQVMEITNEVIRRVVQNAALLIQMQNAGVSRKAELQTFLSLFSACETVEAAHRLSAQVFGAQRARHFTVNGPRATDSISSGTYDEEPMTVTVRPRIRSYRPRMDKGGFQDKSEDKRAQRERLLEEQRRRQEQVTAFIIDGQLDFRRITEPVPPLIRDTFLEWIAAANISDDKRAQTEYGQTFTLHRRSGDACRLVCTDGVLTMPDYLLLFEEAPYA